MANGRSSTSRTLRKAIATPLSPELERRVALRVRSGLYGSREEVLAEAIRLLEDRDRLYAPRLAKLQREVREAAEALDAGHAVSGEDAFAAARLRVRKVRRRVG
jgi:antitoxin ParD1/3/4